MKPIFRLAGPMDLESVLGLLPIYYEHDHLVFERSKAERALAELLADRALGSVWLAYERPEDRSPIGYCVLAHSFSLECGGREAFVDELFVLPTYRGNGIGSAMLEHAASECRRDGIAAMRLEVTATNPDAARLYLRSGFEDLGRSLLVRWLTDDARSVR